MKMASNSFGKHFRITTWGESHGKAIGVVIDGCPAGIEISEYDLNDYLAKRAPGRNSFTSPRKEPDLAEIYSGVFAGKTTGAPISIIIKNKDADSSKYEDNKAVLRPGHANYTYQAKYGIFDYRGGGRASARETACRVAAAALADKILQKKQIKLSTYLYSVANIKTERFDPEFVSDIFAANAEVEHKIKKLLASNKSDSFGGVVACQVMNMPVGLGDPVYSKLDACLAQAMLSIPASKGFEIGSGFQASEMLGSEHNDSFLPDMTTASNNAGGLLGGISNGMPLEFKVAFKPTSSIKKSQHTVDQAGNMTTYVQPKGSRHDPCLAIRAVPVVQAMAALVIVDQILANKIIRFEDV